MSNESGYFAPLPNSLEREISSLKDRISQLESENLVLKERLGQTPEKPHGPLALKAMGELQNLKDDKQWNDWVNEVYSEPRFNAPHRMSHVRALEICALLYTRLQSDKAELQRVVQVKDEALKPFAEATEACKRAFDTNYFKVCEDGPSQPPNTLLIAELRAAKKALELTPKDLPKFIPEEEYLRVKQELVDLSRSHTVTALGKCIEKFELLKTHAEAMAEVIGETYFCKPDSGATGIIEMLEAMSNWHSDVRHWASRQYPRIKAAFNEYRKDFPKEGK